MITNSKYDSSDSDSDSESDISRDSRENNNKIVSNNDLIPMEEIDDDNFYFENNEPDETWDEEDKKQYYLYKESKAMEYETLKSHISYNFEKEFDEVVSKKKVKERSQKVKDTIDLSQFDKSDDEDDTKGQSRWKSRSMERSREKFGLPSKSKKSKCPYKFQPKKSKWTKEESDSRAGKKIEDYFDMDEEKFPSLN